MSQPLVVRSPLDEERFRIRTVRAGRVTASTVAGVVAESDALDAALCIARCDAAAMDAAHALEDAGFRLMDTQVIYGRDLSDLPAPSEQPEVRLARPSDGREVREIAAASFRGYTGHYHADPHLDPRACDEVYASWAERSCTIPGVADVVQIAVSPQGIMGFATTVLHGGTAAAGLDAVAPWARRRGVHRALDIGRLHWCRERGISRVTIATLVLNIAEQRGLVRLGFALEGGEFTFHRWAGAARAATASGL